MYIGNRTFMTLKSAAERIGMDYDTLRRKRQHGLIATTKIRGDYRLTQRELQRFVTTPDCWIAVHPREIIDPDLRQVALDAWRQAGSPRWYALTDLANRYPSFAPNTIKGWRDRGWLAGHWHWQGGDTAGIWWLIWAGDLPAAPMPKPTFNPRADEQRQRAMPARAAVVSAVLALGGLPGKGQRGFWSEVARAADCPIATARSRWRRAVRYNEVNNGTQSQ